MIDREYYKQKMVICIENLNIKVLKKVPIYYITRKTLEIVSNGSSKELIQKIKIYHSTNNMTC